MNSPKISIITASFNSEKTISDTIDSVLNQKYSNIEYVIIDGGSTDNTVYIIKKYESSFNGRLKWISEKDTGIYDAWNKGVTLATGDWITFVGSDDVLLEDAIMANVNKLNNNASLNFISSNAMQVKDDLTPIRVTGKPWGEAMHSFNIITHVGCFHHKSLFQKIGLFNTDYKIAGDYDFLLRCFDIIHADYMPVTTVMIRQGGISSSQIFAVAKEILKIKLKNKSRSILRCYGEYCIMIFKYYLRINLLNYISIFSPGKK